MESMFRCAGQPLSLIVLAGGGSRRMKQNKALLPVGGHTLIEHIIGQLKNRFAETVISVSDAREFSFLPHKIVADDKPGMGPMMGLKCALSVSNNTKSFVIACDIPKIDFSFVKEMIEKSKDMDIVVPVSAEGRLEPLFAVYSKSVIGKMEEFLNSGILSLIPLLNSCRTRRVELDSRTWFKNLNTPAEYKVFLKQAKC